MDVYEIGRVCCMCDKDRWPDMIKMFNKVFLLANSSGSCGYIGLKKNKLFGVSHGGKDVCVPCFYFLVGLEQYYDCFYHELLDNEEAKYVLKKIFSDTELFNKVAKIRTKGAYISEDIIKAILLLRDKESGELN